ncbi:CYTH domain-containing protein [Hoeflea sp.]|uniref:CYTH domain-containing protein n=1 Tax=Hoeflea sp. TaxID=1940281 RepID=UPI003A910376
MALEIERKFLVENDSWRDAVETSRSIVQAYVAIDGDTSLRVRIYDGTNAWLTVKVGVSEMTRHEYEYSIPLADARAMAEASCGRLIEKTRHVLTIEGFAWEVDVYEGRLAGLVTAEVEMASESDAPALPAWLGREVTGEAAWSNAILAINGLPADFHP